MLTLSEVVKTSVLRKTEKQQGREQCQQKVEVEETTRNAHTKRFNKEKCENDNSGVVAGTPPTTYPHQLDIVREDFK